MIALMSKEVIVASFNVKHEKFLLEELEVKVVFEDKIYLISGYICMFVNIQIICVKFDVFG